MSLPHNPTERDLIRLMQRIDFRAARGALIPIRDIRRSAGLPKIALDWLIVSASRKGLISLHRHDWPSSLTQAQRDEMIPSADGLYFIGAAIRQSP